MRDDDQLTIPPTETEMLQEVYRRLVNTHMAIASRTMDDPEILPWTEHQLKSLVNELGAFRRQQRDGNGAYCRRDHGDGTFLIAPGLQRIAFGSILSITCH